MKDDLYEAISIQVEESQVESNIRAVYPDATGMQWKSIESAPKDGTEIILYIPNWNCPITTGRYFLSDTYEYERCAPIYSVRLPLWLFPYHLEGWIAGHSSIVGTPKEASPTYWMPLPSPPVEF